MDQSMRGSSSPSEHDGVDDSPNAPQSATSQQHHNSFSERARIEEALTSTISNESQSQSQQQHHGLNPRSCVTCRKRKVKCDKLHPCSNCRRNGIECIFPNPGRAPRRSKKAPDSELLARLRRLEGVVQKMGKIVDSEGNEVTEESLPTPELGFSSTSEVDSRASGPSPPFHTASTRAPEATSQCELKTDKGAFDKPCGVVGLGKLDHEMGRLVVDHGKSRYVSNKFWAQLTDELAELEELLDVNSSGDEEDQGSTPGGSHKSQEKHTHQEFIFGYSSLMTTLRILHPHPKQIMLYWSLYKENIDPVFRLLHKPTIERMFFEAANDLDHLSKSTEALMFAIYLTVVTSLDPEDCKRQLDIEKSTALARYRYATEQALAKANLVETNELRVLQSCMLFLTTIRRTVGASFAWAMTGLLFRIAQRQGLHRDGDSFGLCGFDTEERRRLWWQLATFDGRTSDDQGVEPMIFAIQYDTKIPLNINDEDIWPGMTERPVEQERPTDMVFDLTRYEIGDTICKLKLAMKRGCTMEFRDQLIDWLREKLESKYLRYCDMSVPLQWVTVNICRLVLAKIWLMAHYPVNFKNGHAEASNELRNRTFIKSIDIIRYTRLLETQHKTMKWGWMFKTYSQWHAAAFAFDELRRRTAGPEIEEAWRVMDEAYSEWESPTSGYTKSILWKPITRLRLMAREARRNEMVRLQTYPTDGSLGPSVALPRDAPLDHEAVARWKGGQPTDDPMPIPLAVADAPPDIKAEYTQPDPTFRPPVRPQVSVDTPLSTGAGILPGYMPSEGEMNHWMTNDPSMQDMAWINDMSDADMNWEELVAAEPIDVNMNAIWGDYTRAVR